MKYDELVTFRWREDRGDEFQEVQVFADVDDEGSGVFVTGDAEVRFRTLTDAYQVRVRHYGLPAAVLADFTGPRNMLAGNNTFEDETLLIVVVRGRPLLVDGIVSGDVRNREFVLNMGIAPL